MFSKEKAPGNGASTGNSEKLINRYYTRKSSQKQFQYNKISTKYVIDWAYLVNDLPNSGYEEEFWEYSKK